MPENNVVIKLYTYLKGECEYAGCRNNAGGLCVVTNPNQASYISKMVKVALNTNTSKLDNLNIVCNYIDVPEGFCEFCGNQMSQIHEPHTYGDSNVFEVFYECLNPKCK